jgi:hypothetical protein
VNKPDSRKIRKPERKEKKVEFNWIGIWADLIMILVANPWKPFTLKALIEHLGINIDISRNNNNQSLWIEDILVSSVESYHDSKWTWKISKWKSGWYFTWSTLKDTDLWSHFDIGNFT